MFDKRTYASTEAELRVGHEVRPLMVLQAISEGVSVHQSTNRVPIPIRAVRVELASIISLRDINLREVPDTSDLDIVGSLHEMDALQRAIRDGTRATTRLGAPSDLLTLGVSNRAHRRRRPEAEIVDVVDPRRLAHRGLRGARATVVRSSLPVLRLVGQLGVVVSRVPDLVRVTVRALPDLNLFRRIAG